MTATNDLANAWLGRQAGRAQADPAAEAADEAAIYAEIARLKGLVKPAASKRMSDFIRQSAISGEMDYEGFGN